MDNLTGPELVKAVSASMPGSNISSIIDKTNDILNDRIFVAIKYDMHNTIFDLVKQIIKYEISEENFNKILKMVSVDDSFSKELRDEAIRFIDSGLFNSISKYLEKPRKCWFKGVICCSSKTL